MEKTDERIAHKMARDLEKAENKRKEREEGAKVLDPGLKETEAGAEEETQKKRRTQEEKDHAEARSSGAEKHQRRPLSAVPAAPLTWVKMSVGKRERQRTKETEMKARRKRHSTTQVWI